MKVRLQTRIKISSGKVGLKKQISSSCDDSNSKKGPRVRDNRPFVLYFDTRPFFIGQGTSIVSILEHNPQTDKTSEMARVKITLSFRSRVFNVILPMAYSTYFTLLHAYFALYRLVQYILSCQILFFFT